MRTEYMILNKEIPASTKRLMALFAEQKSNPAFRNERYPEFIRWVEACLENNQILFLCPTPSQNTIMPWRLLQCQSDLCESILWELDPQIIQDGSISFPEESSHKNLATWRLERANAGFYSVLCNHD